MPIALPTCPMPTDYTVLLRDFGGILTPFLGGPEQRVNRLGTRFGLRLEMPGLDIEDGGMIYLSRLLQGRQSSVILPWPLLDFDPGTPGAPLVSAAVTSGTSIPIKGLIAGYTVKEGQFFSLIHSGRRYIYMFTADGAANSSGDLTASIFPLLRTPLSVNDVLEIARPMIEGLVSPGDELSWQIGLDNAREFSFSVMEAA
ncbi:hypothetical protein V474_07680 [Novosphingobium barchaimii LL02]|uniref:Uncharacterized protein n=1 Tax=Novosphingobium barchaimii LL02 TaxID=1114963 RepID=A0A0J7Y5H3_9SPHN|nr:hypothetical protein [Novosphingobium barchaimii]KMS59136.1 hypothetical protein V474_07680 [Novosphingobium barchaimii LL02]